MTHVVCDLESRAQIKGFDNLFPMFKSGKLPHPSKKKEHSNTQVMNNTDMNNGHFVQSQNIGVKIHCRLS